MFEIQLNPSIAKIIPRDADMDVKNAIVSIFFHLDLISHYEKIQSVNLGGM